MWKCLRLCPDWRQAVSQLGKEVQRSLLSAGQRGAARVAPHEGDDRSGMRGGSSRAGGLLPPWKAPSECILSHLLTSSCLSSEGTQEIQSERNKTRRGIKSLADAKNSPRPLRPGVLGMRPSGLHVLVLSALNCPSQPKMRKLCAGFKTNFICWSPADWVTETSIHLHIYFKHLFNGRHFAKAKCLELLPACWVVGGGSGNKQLQEAGMEE